MSVPTLCVLGNCLLCIGFSRVHPCVRLCCVPSHWQRHDSVRLFSRSEAEESPLDASPGCCLFCCGMSSTSAAWRFAVQHAWLLPQVGIGLKSRRGIPVAPSRKGSLSQGARLINKISGAGNLRSCRLPLGVICMRKRLQSARVRVSRTSSTEVEVWLP